MGNASGSSVSSLSWDPGLSPVEIQVWVVSPELDGNKIIS